MFFPTLPSTHWSQLSPRTVITNQTVFCWTFSLSNIVAFIVKILSVMNLLPTLIGLQQRLLYCLNFFPLSHTLFHYKTDKQLARHTLLILRKIKNTEREREKRQSRFCYRSRPATVPSPLPSPWNSIDLLGLWPRLYHAQQNPCKNPKEVFRIQIELRDK